MVANTIKPIRLFPGKLGYFCAEYLGLPATRISTSQKFILPIGSGGLGVLASDTLKTMADVGQNASCIGMYYRQGYYKQVVTDGRVGEEYPEIPPEDVKELVPVQFENPEIAGHPEWFTMPFQGADRINLRVWKYDYTSPISQKTVPLFLLDAHDNEAGWVRERTDRLYDGPAGCWERLVQYTMLGLGGMRLFNLLLDKEGRVNMAACKDYILTGRERPAPEQVTLFHLNEGHAFMAIPEFLTTMGLRPDSVSPEQLKRAAEFFRFTTHTPVPAGNETVPLRYIEDILKPKMPDHLGFLYRGGIEGQTLKLSDYCLARSERANGVSWKHHLVSRQLFPAHATKIGYVTNGVHYNWIPNREDMALATGLPWPADKILMADVNDRFFRENGWGDWRQDPRQLINLWTLRHDQKFRAAFSEARQNAKVALINWVNLTNPNARMDAEVMTIGVARRFATYKRNALVLNEWKKLLEQCKANNQKLQLIFAGKPHPTDGPNKSRISDLLRVIAQINAQYESEAKVDVPGVFKPEKLINVIFVPNYSTPIGLLLTGGSDVWLNNPVPPAEACGTSGMKHGSSGGLNLSILDGWLHEIKTAYEETLIPSFRKFGHYSLNETVVEEIPPEINERDLRDLYANLRVIAGHYYRDLLNPNAVNDSTLLDWRIGAAAVIGSEMSSVRMLHDYLDQYWNFDVPVTTPK